MTTESTPVGSKNAESVPGPLSALHLEIGLTSLFTLWMAWPFLRTDRFVVGFDTVAYSGPNYATTRALWSHGLLPAWNDAIFGGVPHLANLQTASLYLPKLFMIGTETNRAMGWLVAMHLWFLAMGMVLVARKTFRLSAPSGLVAGVAAVGSGPIMAKAIQFEQIMTVAWAPWLLLGAVGLLRSKRPRLVAGFLSFGTAGAILSGHPQMLLVIAPFLVAGTMAELVMTKNWRQLKPLIASLIVGVGMSMVALGPAFLANRQSQFVNGHAAGLIRNPSYSVDPRAFPQSLLGDLFTPDHAFTARNFEGIVFCGVIVGLLALFAMVAAAVGRRRRMQVGVLSGFAILSLWMALGPRFLLYRLAVAVVPTLNQARVPGRFVVSWALLMAALAAIGVHMIRVDGLHRVDEPSTEELSADYEWSAAGPASRFSDRGLRSPVVLSMVGAAAVAAVAVGVAAQLSHSIDLPPVKTAVSWGLLGAVFFGVLGAGLFAQKRQTRTNPDSPTQPAVLRQPLYICALILSALVVIELGAFSTKSFGRLLLRKDSVTSYRSPIETFLQKSSGRSFALTDDRLSDNAYLVKTLRPNTNGFFEGLRSFDGYDGGTQVTKRWVAVTKLFTPNPDPELTLRTQTSTVTTALAERYGIRWLLVETKDAEGKPSRDLAKAAPGWVEQMRDGSVVLMRNPLLDQEAQLMSNTVKVNNPSDSVKNVPKLDRNTVTVEHGPLLTCVTPKDCEPQSAKLDRVWPGRLHVSVNPKRTSVLRVAESFDPGWKVTVDKMAQPVNVVDGLQLGVIVGPGKHEVVFAYEVPGLWWFVLIALISGVISLWWIIRGRAVAEVVVPPVALAG